MTEKTSLSSKSNWVTSLSLFLAVLSVFILIPIDPEVITDMHAFQPQDNLRQSPPFINHQGITRQDVLFPCGTGDQCHAWLYLPSIHHKLPKLIVMGCGLGAQKDMGMEKYALSFASQGFAVFLFDYRGFGASEGFPRNRIGPFRHLEDWKSAIDYLVNSNAVQDQVDVSDISLWGTSFAGGHVLSVASRLSQSKLVRVRAVVSQMPFLDGNMASLKNLKERGFPLTFRLILAFIQDKMRSVVGLSPVYIPIIGAKGSLAYMNVVPEQLEVYKSRLPKNILGGWKNLAPARGLVEIRQYSPLNILKSGHVQAPVLLIGAEKDELCPIELFELVKDKLHGQVDEHYEDCTHFEIYASPYFNSSVSKMVSFFKEHLSAE